MKQEEKRVTVTYKREMNHNYMIIEAPEQDMGGYESRMLAGNGIEGLLKFRIRHYEEKREFYYEITSKQPLVRLLEQKLISGAEIRRLILEIAAALDRIEQYLLKEEQILLEPEYIYIEPDSFQVYLCMVPGCCGDFPAAFTELLRFLLGKVNHQDKDGVVLAYNLYHESLKENYGMSDLLAHIGGGKDSIFEKEETGPPDFADQSGEEGTYAGEKYNIHAKNEKIRAERENSYSEENGFPPGTKTNSKMFLETGEEDRKNDDTLSGKIIVFRIIKCLLCGGAGEAVLWFLMGEEGLRRYGVAAGVLVVGVVWAAGMFRHRTEREKQKKRAEAQKTEIKTEASTEINAGKITERNPEREAEKESWKVVFGEVRAEEPPKTPEPVTTLLTEKKSSFQIPILESLDRDRENISISYVPFVIGKHEDITDYCLHQPTVSRIHLRLDKKEGVYIVTDLNSTNGTMVEGYHLQANETVSIKNGDTIYLANVGYRFWENKNQ